MPPFLLELGCIIINRFTERSTYGSKTSPDLIPETVTPHCLRHSKAMHLLQANVNLIYIRDLLGHSEIKTTEIYARADTSLKRQALEKASLLNQQIQYPAWTDDDDLMSWLNSFGKC